MGCIKVASILKGINMAICYVYPKVILSIICVIYTVVFGGILDTERTFVTMALIDEVRRLPPFHKFNVECLFYFNFLFRLMTIFTYFHLQLCSVIEQYAVEGVRQGGELMVSIERIEKFLLLEERSPTETRLQHKIPYLPSDGIVLKLTELGVSWSSSDVRLILYMFLLIISLNCNSLVDWYIQIVVDSISDRASNY